MRRRHVSVKGSTLRFSFTGKSGKQWNLAVENKRIASIVRRCADISGHELFKYLDEAGKRMHHRLRDVNSYIKEITQQDFTAKDFRTWAGTVLAALALAEYKKYDTQAEAKRNVVAAIESVARQLGNTPAICRKCYVHPEILEAYLSGDLVKMIEGKIADKFRKQHAKLSADEVMVLAFLNKRLKGTENQFEASCSKPHSSFVRRLNRAAVSLLLQPILGASKVISGGMAANKVTAVHSLPACPQDD